MIDLGNNYMKNRFYIVFFLTIAIFTAHAQNSDTKRYRYKFPFLSGLKDKSELIILEKTDNSNQENNIVGTIFWLRQINTDSTNLIKTDSIEYVPFRANLILTNKTDTVDEFFNDTIAIKIPVGKYKLSIFEVGMGFINRTIRIRENTIYTFTVKLKTRRMIGITEYICTDRLSKKEIKALKKHYKFPDRFELIETKCKCDIIWTIYG